MIDVLKQALEGLEMAQDNLRPHDDNCFLHDEGEYYRCFCGKDSLSNYLQEKVENLDQAIKVYESAPPEAQTEAEKTAFAFGWFKALEANHFRDATKLMEPVAFVTGVYGGRFTYAPYKESAILPVGTALYLAA